MNYLEKIEKLIQKQHGTILSSDIDKFEIPRVYLQMMVSEGRLERIDRGIYIYDGAIEDEMFVMQKKYSKLIYSHETALFIHGLSDRTPFEYAATVPSGYKVVPNIAERFKVYYIKREFHELGMEILDSSFGNQIRVYNIERTICDIIKSRSRIDIQIFNEALRRFVKMKSPDYSVLMDYAKKLRVETVLNKYLEVLL